MATVNNAQQQTATYIQNGERKQGVAYQQTTQAPAAQAYQAAAAPERQSLVDNEWYGGQQEAARKYYEESKAANQQAAAAAEERARTAAQEQRDALAAGYQGTNRQLYRDYMERQRLLPQQLAAQGYGGGLSESARIRLGNSYGEALAENERARLREEADIRSALARQEYETMAAADAANRQALQERYGNLAALRTKQYQQQHSDALARAQTLAAAGDYSGYRSLGYTPEEIEYLGGMWRAQNPELAAYQRNTALPSVALSAPEDSSAYSVARYIQQTQGLDRAIEYVAEELAAGNLFSDEAEAIRKAIRAIG